MVIAGQHGSEQPRPRRRNEIFAEIFSSGGQAQLVRSIEFEAKFDIYASTLQVVPSEPATVKFGVDVVWSSTDLVTEFNPSGGLIYATDEPNDESPFAFAAAPCWAPCR